MATKVNCPQCQKVVIWNDESKWKPFCSERCKLIDLGEWAEGNHRIAGEATPSTQSDFDPSDYH